MPDDSINEIDDSSVGDLYDCSDDDDDISDLRSLEEAASNESGGKQPEANKESGVLVAATSFSSSDTGLRQLTSCGMNMTREQLVAKVYSILSPLLKACLYDKDTKKYPPHMELLDRQLHSFIQEISTTYTWHTRYHAFCHTAHIVAWVHYFHRQLQLQQQQASTGSVGSSCWDRLVLCMAALVRDCKYSGVSDRQLLVEHHYLWDLYKDGNVQTKLSINYALDILAGPNFKDLLEEITWGCPRFLYLMRTTLVLGTGKRSALKQYCVTARTTHRNNPRGRVQRNEALMGMVLQLANWGHFALANLEEFVEWNNLALEEKRLAFLAKRGPNPLPHWNTNCIQFMELKILPLAEAMERILPKPVGLRDSVLANLQFLQQHQQQQQQLQRKESSSPTCFEDIVDVYD